MQGIFAGLGNAPTFERGTWFAPGIYVVQIERVLVKRTQQSGLGLIVEFEILNAQQSSEINPQTGYPYAPNPIGTKGTWFQSLESQAIALPAIKSFVFAALALQANDPRIAQLAVPLGNGGPALIENMMAHAAGEGNILQGLILNLECEMTKTRKNTDFTLHKFSAVNFAGLGIPERAPNLDRLFGISSQPITFQPPPAAAAPVGWGQPQAAPQGPPNPYAQPPQPQGWQGAPQGPRGPQWPGQPPQGFQGAPAPTQGPPPGWGQPQAAPQWGPPAPSPQAAPPPGWGQPQAAPQPPPAAPQWGAPNTAWRT